MRITTFIVAGIAMTAAGVHAQTAGAVETCGYSWAVPGQYTVVGDFRGRVERTRTRLSSNCRIHFTVPGVFSGGPVQKAGGCLNFTFKVRNEPEAFSARWCDGYADIPWNGRVIRASVQLSRQQADDDPRTRQRSQWQQGGR